MRCTTWATRRARTRRRASRPGPLHHAASVWWVVMAAMVVVTLDGMPTTHARLNYQWFVSRSVADGVGYPSPDREGTVFGNVGGTRIYFAGGVNTLLPSPTNFTAFSDIYTYDTANNQFVKAAVSLPAPVYYGAGGFAQGALIIYSGRTNTQLSPATYFSDMYVVNFTNSITTPSVSTVTLNPSVLGRSFHSTGLFRNNLYVFGGVTGVDNATPIPIDQLFISININNGSVTKLPCNDTQCPSSAPVSPVMYLDPSEEIIYIYSGMANDLNTWADNSYLYIFDIIANEWKSPVLMPTRRNFVFNSLADTLQPERELLIIGGDLGNTGSYAQSYLLDFMQNPPAIEYIQYGNLPQKCESLNFVGVDAGGNIWAFGGATYASSNAPTALNYCHGVVTMEYYQDPNKTGTGTKWAIGIAMVLVLAAIIGALVYLYQKNKTRRDYIAIP